MLFSIFVIFPTFTNNTNLQIFAKWLYLLLCFLSHLKVVECRCCTQAEKAFDLTEMQTHGPGHGIPMFKSLEKRPMGYAGAPFLSCTYLNLEWTKILPRNLQKLLFDNLLRVVTFRQKLQKIPKLIFSTKLIRSHWCSSNCIKIMITPFVQITHVRMARK